LAVTACLFSSVAVAQTVIVQFVDGRNGKPIGKGKTVHVIFFIAPIRHLLSLHTDQDGKVEFEAEAATDFKVAPVGYTACGEPSGEAMKDYSIAEIMNAGLVTANNCGNAVSQPEPGRLIYFVKPGSHLEQLKKYLD
jgi:hypothetical protein